MAAQKEAWNTSNEKTKELTMAMFGPVEEGGFQRRAAPEAVQEGDGNIGEGSAKINIWQLRDPSRIKSHIQPAGQL